MCGKSLCKYIFKPLAIKKYSELSEGDIGICGVAVLVFFYCGDAVNKISICGVAVISNPSVCDVCLFHAAVFGEMKLFLRPKFSMITSSIHGSFSGRLLVMFMDFHRKAQV